MNVVKINYNPNLITQSTKKKLKQYSNIIYFFYDSCCNDCLYIGETKTTLFERCYKHTPKESTQPWFIKGDTIYILELDNKVDDFSRRTIESLFITTIRPLFNQKS